MLLVLFVSSSFGMVSNAAEYSYEDISKRYNSVRLEITSVEDARMQGECLVGLKHLNFQKRTDFDPVAEWTNYRAFSLLEQYPPCTVLIIIEVARRELQKDAD
jgi:hypothetical protein